LPGLDIGRSSVEVPLAFRLPRELRDRVRTPAGDTVGLDRVHATLLELAGVRPRPAAAPSLLRPSGWAALSELWFAGGSHQIGLYEGGFQLRWRCRFASEEPGFEEDWRRALDPLQGGAYGEAIARLEAEFRRRPACTLGEEWSLEVWRSDGSVGAVDDTARRDRMIERLRALHRFPPLWSTGPPPPLLVMQRRELLALSGWGLPVPGSWAAPRPSAS
jgi:hypothetical protein